MVTENIEMTIFALALLIITANIIICSWFIVHEKYLQVGAWITRITGVIPGFLAISWGVYIKITDSESTLGMALFSAGLLLEFGAIQLLSIILHKLSYTPNKN